MNKELLKGIAIAGLFHDIGKFAERAYAIEPGDPDMVRQDYNYGHAFNTEQALEKLFSEEVLSRNLHNRIGMQECTILNLAARHHKPRHAYEAMNGPDLMKTVSLRLPAVNGKVRCRS